MQRRNDNQNQRVLLRLTQLPDQTRGLQLIPNLGNGSSKERKPPSWEASDNKADAMIKMIWLKIFGLR